MLNCCVQLLIFSFISIKYVYLKKPINTRNVCLALPVCKDFVKLIIDVSKVSSIKNIFFYNHI